jgi:hypothetical protein
MDAPIATGAIPSPTDYRDLYGKLVAKSIGMFSVPARSSITLPTSLHHNTGAIMNQQRIPACVAHSIVKLMKLYWFGKTGVMPDLSPRFLDILGAESWIPIDGGRVPRTLLTIATDQGCATQATLPNDTSLSIQDYRNPATITDASREEALKYRIPGYISINLDLMSVREGVYFYGAVSSLFMVGDELWTPDWLDKDIDPMRPPTQIVYGHQMTDVGWDDPLKNRLSNQWSEQWANGGEIDYDPVLWRPYVMERWAIAELPADIVAFMKTLPNPQEFHYQWNTNLTQGSSGSDDVKFAQVALMILGYLAPLEPNELGIYGPKTAAAVASLQSDHGISPVPASIGPKTRAILNSKFQV